MTSSLSNSLRCLSHPISLLCIALLIVNDHVLKFAAPSWLMGKLSDFAGLFFFPFLLAALLGAVLDRLGFSSRRIGLFAFGATAVWFSLIKTTLWVNTLTEDLLSSLFGFQVQIVIDPSDLIALVVLFPAWQLWKREERAQPSRVAWITLAVATLASIATSPLPPTPRVVRVADIDGSIYAGLGAQNYSKQISGKEQLFSAAEGGSDGATWRETTQIPPGLAREITYPLVLCHPDNRLTCYRISIPEQIEQSNNGGETWSVAWSVPWGRRYFMDRYNCQGIGCRKTGGIDLGPYDMTFLNRNGSYTLLVAMGNEGILARTSEGRWDRRPILRLVPTPFSVTNPLEGLSMLFFGEAIVLAPTSFIVFLLFNLIGLAIVLRKLRSHPWRSNWWVMRPLLFPIVLLLGLAGINLCLMFVVPMFAAYPREIVRVLNTLSTFEWSVFAFIIIILTPIGSLLSWRRAASLVSSRRQVWKCAGWTVLASIAVFPLLLGSLISWTMGIIALYELALGFGVAASVTLWVIAYRQIRGASLLSAMPSAPGIDSP